MGKPHPVEIRERVFGFADDGNSHRAAARHFRTSPKFVNDMIKQRRSTGGLSPKRQGNPGRGKLSRVWRLGAELATIAPGSPLRQQFFRAIALGWCIFQADRRIRSERKRLLLMLETIGHPPKLAGGWLNEQEQASSITDFEWLFSGTCIPASGVGQRHGGLFEDICWYL